MFVRIIEDEGSGELERELTEAVDDSDGDASDWMRGAFVIRLYMENDEEFLEKAKAERADN